jgi:hypothetical protein
LLGERLRELVKGINIVAYVFRVEDRQRIMYVIALSLEVIRHLRHGRNSTPCSLKYPISLKLCQRGHRPEPCRGLNVGDSDCCRGKHVSECWFSLNGNPLYHWFQNRSLDKAIVIAEDDATIFLLSNLKSYNVIGKRAGAV